MKKPYDPSATLLTPLQKTRKAIFDKRVEMRKEKSTQLIAIYQNKLKEYIKIYFESRSDDNEENEKVFQIINTDWKDLCYKVNATQKIIKLQNEAFETNVSIILKKNKIQYELSVQNATKSEEIKELTVWEKIKNFFSKK